MNPTIASLLVEDHINDLIRETQRRRRDTEVRRRRRIGFLPSLLVARSSGRRGPAAALDEPSSSASR